MRYGIGEGRKNGSGLEGFNLEIRRGVWEKS
jgi:hypothetical protein